MSPAVPTADDRPSPVSPPGERRPATVTEVKALSHPLRLRIIRETLEVALTNAEIAERVGRDKATVLHHVRVLVQHGFLVAGEPRRGARGAREIPYVSTGRSWLLSMDPANYVDPAALARVDDAMIGAFVEEVAAAKGSGPVSITRLAVHLTDAERAELEATVQDYLDRLARRRRGDAPDASPYAVFLALYPRPVTPPAPSGG